MSRADEATAAVVALLCCAVCASLLRSCADDAPAARGAWQGRGGCVARVARTPAGGGATVAEGAAAPP